MISNSNNNHEPRTTDRQTHAKHRSSWFSASMFGHKDIGQIKDLDMYLLRATGRKEKEDGLGFLELGNK